jgi:putative ABC transport system substrate-binding protein
VRRRSFITILGGAAAWPVAARAQQPSPMRRIGMLISVLAQSDPEGQARVAAFLNTFQELGWTPGRNVQIDIRWPAGNVALANAHAAELVGSAPDVILVAGNEALAELQRLTKTIPIVFVQVSDPIGSGFVQSLARPEGNITGFENFEPAMGGKWLGIIHEVAPNVSRAAVLMSPLGSAHVAFLRAAEAVAPSLGMQVIAASVHDGAEIERAITTFAGTSDGGLIVLPHPITSTHRGSIIELAARHRLPAVYPYRFFTRSGGLVSYGIDQLDQWPRAARYVDRVFRGAKLGELPVQAPTKFELVINLKTAKAMGLDIPPAFPLRADEVIE